MACVALAIAGCSKKPKPPANPHPEPELRTAKPARPSHPSPLGKLPPQRPGKGPKLAIIIDDIGYDGSAADSVLALNFPVTVSVLPNLPLSTEVADAAHRRGDQVMLHLPMQSEGEDAKAETVELRVGMRAGEVNQILKNALASVPYVVGVNNHQGSAATSNAVLMAELMPALKKRNLFFIDSRTEKTTVAYEPREKPASAPLRAKFSSMMSPPAKP